MYIPRAICHAIVEMYRKEKKDVLSINACVEGSLNLDDDAS